MTMKPSGPASWQPEPDSGIAIEWIEAGSLTFEVATAGEGDHLALCLHGFPELHYSWRHQMPLLAEMGYRVWAPNLRGYGGTSRPEGTDAYRLRTLAQDVAALIDASGATKVTLIAHDWGAIIAWYFAIMEIRPLERLVIMNVPHPRCGQRELKTWRQLRKSWYIFFFQLPRLPELLLGRRQAMPIERLFKETTVNSHLFDETVRETYRQAAAMPGALTAMFNYYRALIRRPDARDIGAGQVKVPTLIVWGEHDVAIDIHCLDGTEEYVPELEVHRLPDASHWVQQDAPDQVNRILRSWLPSA
ncbi:epoxide hydrolase [Erythrobacter sp. JL475]|nr:epoxide hydrolase [Erythrobacter sp. JL475]